MNKKFLVAGLVGLMTLSVGCGSIKDTMADITNTNKKQETVKISEQSTPEEIFEASAKAMVAQDVKAKMTMELGMEINLAKKGIIFTTEGNVKQQFNQLTTGIIDYNDDNDFIIATTKKDHTKYTATIAGEETSEDETKDTEEYIVATQSEANKYTNSEDTWETESISLDAAREELTIGTLDDFIENAKSVEVIGSQSIGSQNCITVKVVQDWKKVMQPSEEDLEWAGSINGDIEATLYFGEQDNYLYKIDFEFSDEFNQQFKDTFSEAMLEEIDSNKAECEVSQMNISMTYELYDWGVDNTIEVPQEALNAR